MNEWKKLEKEKEAIIGLFFNEAYKKKSCFLFSFKSNT